MQEIRDQLRVFKQNQLDQVTLECQSHSAITEDIPACVVALANQFSPRFWDRLIAVNLSGCQLERFPVCLKICECLQELNLSRNCLHKLPAQLLVQYFPFLKILDISENYISNLKDIQLLGQLDELEVLSVRGNNFSKVDSRIELLSSLFFGKVQAAKYFKKENNRMAVFMSIGNQKVIESSQAYVEALKRLVKAAEFLKSRPLSELKQGNYEAGQLPVDIVQLHDGSLFYVRGDVWLRGPGVTLIKDDRIQSPLVVITASDSSDIVGVTQQTKQFILRESQQYDEILSKNNSAYVDNRSIKYGFFGNRYFCYDAALKTRQKQQNERQLSTIDFIKKSVVRDQRIMSTANQAKLEKPQLNLYTMLPSEIYSKLRSSLQETHFITNLNQRYLYTEAAFQRLRVLDGQVITISEYDQARKSHTENRTNHALILQAAQPLQSSLAHPPKINMALQKAENGTRISGQAAIDMRLEASAINTTEQLSEEIRKRQIYDRVVSQNAAERTKARQELRNFIQTGNLADEDGEYQFSMLLRAYDEEQDPDIFTFIQQCKALQNEYSADRQARDRQQAIDCGVVPNLLAEDDLTMSQRYSASQKQAQTSSRLKRDGDNGENPLLLSHLQTTEAPENPNDDVLLLLSYQSKALKSTERASYGERMGNEQDALQSAFAPRQTAQDRVYNIEMAAMYSYIAQDEMAARAAPKQQQVQLSQFMSPSVTYASNLDQMRQFLQHSSPLRHVQNSTSLYAYAADYEVSSLAEKSQIFKNRSEVADVITRPLPFETDHISFEDMKTLSLEVQRNAAGLTSISPSKLTPSFDEVLRHELQAQHSANNELFKQISLNLDQSVRKYLTIPQITVPVKDSSDTETMAKRHPAILDVVVEGDQLRAAPNKIINQKNRAAMLKYTTDEIMEKIDSSIMHENIMYELEKQGQGSSSTIKAMLKQNNEDIENQEMKEKRSDHLRRLALIRKEKPIAQYYIRPSGQYILLAKQQRKVQQIERRNALLNNHKYTIIGQRQQVQRKTANGKDDILDIETIEDAAEHAKLINIGASELIDAGNRIMANAEQHVDELHEYGQEFIRREMEWDEQQSDEVYRLMRGKSMLTSDAIAKVEQVPDIQISDESRRFGLALLRGKDTKGIFKPRACEAKEIAEGILESIDK